MANKKIVIKNNGRTEEVPSASFYYDDISGIVKINNLVIQSLTGSQNGIYICL